MLGGDARIQFCQSAELIPKLEILQKCSAANASVAIIKMLVAVVVGWGGGFAPEYRHDMYQCLTECVFL